MTPNRRIEIPEGVMVRELQGESVLLNLDSECYFGLDEVGTRMWNALASSADTDAACEALTAEYDVAPERLRADLEDFVARLARAGLVRVAPL
jgi:hypothetical protein